MGYIPQSFIDELLARLDIVDIINARVPLRKAGRNYMACCPFHNEKTPSFSVVPDKQFYNCFGCGAAGSAVKFVMSFDGLDFVEAIEKLANEAGLEIPESTTRSDQGKQNRTKILYKLLDSTAQFYSHNLFNNNSNQSELSKKALLYLQKRGIDLDIAKFFNLGFAPDGWDNLTKALTKVIKQEEPEANLQQLLEEAGLWIRKTEENKQSSYKGYDRFRSRLMFPIRDIRGRIIAFGGRVLDDSKPKYLNSPETVLFHKSAELYGLYESLHNSQHKKASLSRFVIVEGYADVIALFQHGIDYAVATLGTATSYRHLAKLFKYCQEVIYCFDGDEAGQSAAWRALENSLGALYDGRVIKFLFLPDGHDPDTYIRKFGKNNFEQMLNESMSLTNYLFAKQEDILKQQGGQNLQSVEGRVSFVKLCKPLINKVPQGAYRTILETELAKKCHLDQQNLEKIVNDQSPAMAVIGAGAAGSNLQQSSSTPVYPRPSNTQQSHKPSLWRRACLLLVHNPCFIELVSEQFFEYITTELIASSKGAKLFYKICQGLSDSKSGSKPVINTASISSIPSIPRLLDGLDSNTQEHVSLKNIVIQLLDTDPMVTDDSAKQEFVDILTKIHSDKQQNEMDRLQAKIVEQGMGSLTAEEKARLQSLLIKN